MVVIKGVEMRRNDGIRLIIRMETGNFCCVKETTANAENCTSSFDTRSASKMTQRLFCEEMNVDVH